MLKATSLICIFIYSEWCYKNAFHAFCDSFEIVKIKNKKDVAMSISIKLIVVCTIKTHIHPVGIL